ncbi:lysylphosphatidylglycerol synthase transmembrane domain-containing protein [Sediminitomix flava]|uniref:Lysylphosphatidylglycerol synthase-like protein n=1 Tax=Sediminitomix flava TaxID=379075 RepID=A0A315Z7I5_SEDFL|nr:lysylphosphatidylglycerol synthase transmembrane domain-containing protein [Sediminitomix flava]PWJ40817.1 hypothetical protein BC781_10476 [Sediminitomix flava]
MDQKSEKMLKELSPRKIVIPILVGLAVMVYLFYSSSKDISAEDFEKIKENIINVNIWWVIFAVLVLFLRDFGYMYRIRNLTHKHLNWVASFYVIILWEFASAVTPSVVGGTAVAVFILNKEKIPFGKSIAYVMLTAVLDNLFFVVASTLVILFMGTDIFPDNNHSMMLMGYQLNLEQIFLVSVSLIAIYTLFMGGALFFAPKAFKRILIGLTSLPFLTRWRESAVQSGNDMIIASEQLRGQKISYWLKAVISTLVIWSARYLMLNCLINAFLHVDLTQGNWDDWYQQAIIFARQIIMWIVMLISPTPGSSGTAEYFFQSFFDEFFTAPGLVLVVALFWRLFTYYAYLIFGAIVLPNWVKRVFYKKRTS